MVFFGKIKDSNEYGFGVFEERFDSYIEIDEEEHMRIINKANNENKEIKADENGKPILVDRPLPSKKEIAETKIRKFQSYLLETDWYAIRFAETGKAIPDEIKKKRQDARDEISKLRLINDN